MNKRIAAVVCFEVEFERHARKRDLGLAARKQQAQRPRHTKMVSGFLLSRACLRAHGSALRWAVWGHPRGCAGACCRSANPARSTTFSWQGR